MSGYVEQPYTADGNPVGVAGAGGPSFFEVLIVVLLLILLLR